MARGGRAAYGHVRKPKTEVDGIKFMSPGEAERYLELRIMQCQGKILAFDLQPKFEIQPKFRKNGVLYRPIHYIADFRIQYADGHVEIEDVKGWGGYTTPEFKLKHKLFEHKFPDLSLVMLKRNGKLKRIEELKKELAELTHVETTR